MIAKNASGTNVRNDYTSNANAINEDEENDDYLEADLKNYLHDWNTTLKKSGNSVGSIIADMDLESIERSLAASMTTMGNDIDRDYDEGLGDDMDAFDEAASIE
ncbi:hypothetical protein GUJ93_ZPchr0007g3830 [Zizania palustris]|uniref:Uncharacterized protein n=1 Tax=Zizania palustris TaxID=103762 RepID=A0A8J5W5G7_ZIZPA|nr:hypothetical protein GUJ93_ZPchr0007g3830 [Zizania palustris]